MVSEINSFSGALQPFESDQVASSPKIAETAEKAIPFPTRAAALDPIRVTNAISYLVEKVEDIQAIEKLYYAHIKHRDEDVKQILSEMKNRPAGLTSYWVVSYAFSRVVEDENIDLMNFIFDEFKDRLALDGDVVFQAVEVYAIHGEEERAIGILDYLNAEDELDRYRYDLEDLLEVASENEMHNLVAKLTELSNN